jgi:peroxiredoxin
MLKKMLFKTIILAIFGIAVSTAYAQNPFTIKGSLGKDKQGMIRIVYQNQDKSIVDSTQIKDGMFELKGKVGDPTVATLILNPSTNIMSISWRDDVQEFFLDGGNTIVKSEDGMKTASISGGKAQSDFLRLMAQRKPIVDQQKTLMEMGQKYKAEMNDTGLIRIQGLGKPLQQKRMELDSAFIRDNPDSYVAFGLFIMKKVIGPIDLPVIEPQFKQFSANICNSETGKNLAKRITIAHTIDVGKLAPNFILNDTLNQPVSLSSLRGKYVLLWFWHSAVTGIETEYFNLNKVYKKFKDKNFTILAVSYERDRLDRNNVIAEKSMDTWKKIIRQNNMHWINVSDFGGIGNKSISTTAQAYDLTYGTIPQCLLIGPDGTILLNNRLNPEDNKLVGKIESIIGK